MYCWRCSLALRLRITVTKLSGAVIYSGNLEATCNIRILKQLIFLQNPAMLPATPNGDPLFRMRLVDTSGTALASEVLVSTLNEPINLQLILQDGRHGYGVLMYGNRAWYTGFWRDDKQEGVQLGFVIIVDSAAAAACGVRNHTNVHDVPMRYLIPKCLRFMSWTSVPLSNSRNGRVCGTFVDLLRERKIRIRTEACF